MQLRARDEIAEPASVVLVPHNHLGATYRQRVPDTSYVELIRSRLNEC